MTFEQYDQASDSPLNRSICPNKCGISLMDIEQNPCLECNCEWFQTEKHGEEEIVE